MRAVALTLWCLSGCAPVIPNGALSCDDGHACPDGLECRAGRCWRTDTGECGACLADFSCLDGACVHPCGAGFGVCPAQTRCDLVGGCVPCAEEACLTPCVADEDCADGYCEAEVCTPLVRQCSTLQSPVSAERIVGCYVDGGDQLDELGLRTWCCGYELGSEILPVPSLAFREGRVVVDLMGRESSTGAPHAFSLLKSARPSWLDFTIDLVLSPPEVDGDPESYGVVLEIAVFATSGWVAVVRRDWGAVASGVAEVVESPDMLVSLGQTPLRPDASPEPVRVEVPSLLPFFDLEPDAVGQVIVALTIWTRGPRLVQRIDTFSVTPM